NDFRVEVGVSVHLQVLLGAVKSIDRGDEVVGAWVALVPFVSLRPLRAFGALRSCNVDQGDQRGPVGSPLIPPLDGIHTPPQLRGKAVVPTIALRPFEAPS